MLAAAVAVDLGANFTAGPPGAVNVYISGARTNRRYEFVKFSGADSSFIREVSDIRRRDGARDRRWWRRAWLSACGSIAEVRAKEHADRASHGFLSKVDVSLLNSAFKVGVTELPGDLRFIITDARGKGSITGRRNC